MKRKTRSKKTNLTKQNEILEFIAGILTIIILVLILVKLVGLFINKPKKIEKRKESKNKPACTIKPKLKVTGMPKMYTYIVKDGDSFWRISEKICGNGNHAETIRQLNNYTWQSLLEGDVIKVNCDN